MKWAVSLPTATISISVKTDISFNFITAAWTAVLTLIFTPIYVHYLGLEAYGLIGLLATLQVSLAVLNLGLGHVLARELARFTAVGISEQSARNLTHSVEAITLVVAIVIAVSIAVVADWIGQSWLRPGQTPIAGFIFAIDILGFLLALRLVEGVYRGAVTGLHKQVRLNLTTIFCVTLRAFGSLFILLFVSRSIAVFFIWQAIVSALNVFLLRRIVYGSFGDRNLGTKFSLFELKKIARFAAGITSMSVLGVALTQTDKLLLSKLLLLNEYGEYMLAVTLAAAPLTLAGPISQAAQPRFARAFAINNNGGLAQLFHASSQLLTVLVGSAAIVIACFSREVLTLWLHDPALAERLTGS